MIVLHPLASLGKQQLFAAEIHSTISTPWRTARLRASRLSPPLQVKLGYRGGKVWTAFEAAQPDDLAGDWYNKSEAALVRGLPEWRREVGPQSFQDGRLETVLRWLAGACGGQLELKVKGKPFRHYQVRRGPAHRAVTDALLAWRVDAVLLELDGGKLYIGPEAQSPHALAGIQAKLVQATNLFSLSDVGDGRYRLVTPGMAWLRVSHRVQVKHELFSGTLRLLEVKHRWQGSAYTELEGICDKRTF